MNVSTLSFSLDTCDDDFIQMSFFERILIFPGHRDEFNDIFQDYGTNVWVKKIKKKIDNFDFIRNHNIINNIKYVTFFSCILKLQ